MKTYSFLFLLLSLSVILVRCSKDNMENEPAINYQKIGEGYATGAATKVELYAKQTFTTGYNPIYIALYDSISGKRIETADISCKPMMDMGSMKHSAPVENPASTATEKLFPAAAVFTMPSGSMGSWTIDLTVVVSEKQGKLSIPVTVTDPTTSELRSIISKADNAKFIVALVQPNAPKVGVNDMEIAIYKVKNMMEFPADSSLTVTLTPEMPTMGHGSPNNVDPVHISKGHYKGKVNFTMTGLWYLNLDLKTGTAIADTATFFEVNF